MTKSHLLLALCMPLTLLSLSACGGGGAGFRGGDKAQITETIEKALAGHEPSACTELKTRDYVRQETIEVGEQALESCERGQKDAIFRAEAVTVSNIKGNGVRARADTAVVGSSIDGQTVRIALINQAGRWKLDRLVRFVKLDRASLIRTEEELFASSPDAAVTQRQLDCMADVISRAPRRELEASLLHIDISGSFSAMFAKEQHCLPGL